MVIWDWGIAKYSNSFCIFESKTFLQRKLSQKNDWGL